LELLWSLEFGIWSFPYPFKIFLNPIAATATISSPVKGAA